MKQKMKKYLSLTLSFVFLLSNCQLFAQEAFDVKGLVKYLKEEKGWVPLLDMQPEAYKPLEDAYIEQLRADLTEVRENLEALKTNINQLFAEKDINKIRDVINPKIVRLQKEIEDPYITLFGDIDKLHDYVSADIKTEPMERLAREYVRKHPLPKPTPSIAEGVVFYKMKKRIKEVMSIYEKEGIIASKEIVLTEGEINTILYEMEARLRYTENNLAELIKGNEEIYATLNAYIRKTGITGRDVVKYALETIPEHDLKLLGLAKATEFDKFGKLTRTFLFRKYLKAIGSKEAKSGFFNLMKRVTAEEIHRYVYKAGYEDLLHAFPAFPKGNPQRVALLGRKALRATPLLIIGTFLTAAVITQVRSDNSFFAGTLGPRAMKGIANKIDNGTASIGEIVAFYNSPFSDSFIEKDPIHAENAIKLSLAARQLYENFDEVDKLLVEEEKQLASSNINVNEEVSNKLDEQLANVTEKVSQYENMI